MFLRILKALFRLTTYQRLHMFFPKDPVLKIMLAHWHYGNLPREYLKDVFPGIDKVNIVLDKPFISYNESRYEQVVRILELSMICAIIQFVNAKNILEIGTFIGNTTLNMAINSNARIVTVDLAPVITSRSRFSTNPRQTPSEVGYRFKNSHYKVKQVFADSTKLDWKTLKPPFDVIFIDGEHRYDHVKKDTENALKYGKVIIWHDYCNYKDIAKVVEECPIETHAIMGTRLAVGINKII
jgi:hypothetical protein